MTYTQPIGEIVELIMDGQRITTVVRSSRPLAAPVAPAGLYELSEPSQLVLELHKLIRSEEDLFTFETYQSTFSDAVTGSSYIIQSWWTDEAFDIVKDTTRQWRRARYPGTERDCVRCLLTYKHFGAQGERDVRTEGYVSGDVWITIEAYERFIAQDVLRIRST
jgi:hypothetical protein